MAASEKRYNPKDTTFNYVKKPDDIDLDDDLTVLRTKLPCGHVVSPESLTMYCKMELGMGKTVFKCPALNGMKPCDAVLPYHVVRKFALLTPAEQLNFEEQLGRAAIEQQTEYKACPGCNLLVEREDICNLSVQCKFCTTRTGRTYEFCWKCSKEWKGERPRADRCGNDGCTNEELTLLQTCKYIKFECVNGVKNCPSVRACPTCGKVLEHNRDACKNIPCDRCRVEFCFVCLRLTANCAGKDGSYYRSCSVGTAPRQTSIPYWKR